MDENFFLRSCWNKRLTKEQFLEEVHKEYDKIPDSLIKKLSNICSTSIDSFPAILSYLFALFSSDLQNCIEYIDLNQSDEINGILKMFCEYGDRVFVSEDYLNADICRSSLKILEICLKTEDKNLQKSAFFALSRSHQLSVAISSSRVLIADEFNSIHERFKDVDIFDARTDVSQLQRLFEFAIKSENVTKTINKHSQPEVFQFCTAAIRLWRQRSVPAEFYSISFFNDFHVSIILSFLNNPSLTDAFFVTSILPKYIFLASNSQTEIDYVYNKEEFIEATKILNYDSEMFPGITREDVVKIFTSEPESLDYSNILEQTFQYPCLVANFIENLEVVFKSGDIDNISKLVNDIERNMLDFICHLRQRECYIRLLTFLFDILLENDMNVNLFPIIYEFFFYVIKNLMRGGSTYDRSIVNEFIKQMQGKHQDNSYFLDYFVNSNATHQPLDSSFNNIINEESYITKNNMFIDYIHENTEIDRIRQILYYNDYLWPSFLIYQSRNIDKIQSSKSLKFPDTKLNNYLFNQMMTIKMQPIKDVFMEDVDYDTLISSNYVKDDKDLSNAKAQFSFPLDSWPNLNSLYSTIIVLRAWYSMFGSEALIKGLFSIVCRSPLILMRGSLTQEIFISNTIIVALVCEDEHSLLFEVLTSVKNILTENMELIQDGKRLAMFCLSIILVTSKGYKEKLEFVFEICNSIISNIHDANPLLIDFAYTFIKSVCYIRRLHDMIPLEFTKIFNTKSDWKSLIDFFVIRANKEKSFA